jgi:energy-coupling factor transporter ATP-binding protein EcfA2
VITLLTGKKGSGKTKKLIELVGAALEKTQGNVVVIEKGQKLTYDISHAARLVDSDAYDVKGVDALCGFLSGICAGNYDVTDIFVDSTLKITGSGAEALETIIPELEKLSKAADTNFCLSISAADEEIPAVAAEYILK